MENCGFLLFGKKIWFDRSARTYVTKYVDSSFNKKVFLDDIFLERFTSTGILLSTIELNIFSTPT
jgi:hypothetical protein